MNFKTFFKSKTRTILFIIGAFLVFLLLFDFHRFVSVIDWLLAVFRPLLIGGCIAFTLNLFIEALNDKVFGHLHFKKDETKDAISLFTAVILLILIVVLLLWFVIPQLVQSFRLLIQSVPGVLRYLQQLGERLLDRYPDIEKSIASLNISPDDISNNVINYLQHFMSGTIDQTYNFATNTIGMVFTVFISIMFSFFIILYKDKLGRQCRQLLFTYCSEKAANQTLYIFHLAYRYFNAFIYGQLVSAVVMFVLFMAIALILRLPYALMIGVIIMIFSLIPMFGSYIAYAIGVLLILSVNPIQAVYFSVVYFIVCNLEGNVIYPKVVGSTLGLPGIWILAAVTVGANMYGIVGMIFSVPIVAIIYTLLSENSQKILKDKESVIGQILNKPNWKYYNYQTHTFESKPVEITNVLTEDEDKKDKK